MCYFMDNTSPADNRPVSKEPMLNLRKKISAVFVVICVLGGVSSWYFLYFTKTPEYALNQVRQAVEKHDLVKFNQYVDLNSILSRGYDDLITAMLESDRTLTPEIKKVISGFSKIFKFPVVGTFKEGILRLVETGKWETQAKDESSLQGIDTEQLVAKTGFTSSSIKNVAYTKKEGKTAIVGITIAEKDLQKNFVLEIKMRELEDGTWQVAELSNFKEYLLEIEKAKLTQLEKYLTDSQIVLDVHNQAFKQINAKIENHIASANLANAEESNVLRILIESELLPNLNTKIEELGKITVPANANALHELRLKGCETDIQYAQKMLEWVERKNPQTLKEANQLLQHSVEITEQIRALTAETKASIG